MPSVRQPRPNRQTVGGGDKRESKSSGEARRHITSGARQSSGGGLFGRAEGDGFSRAHANGGAGCKRQRPDHAVIAADNHRAAESSLVAVFCPPQSRDVQSFFIVQQRARRVLENASCPNRRQQYRPRPAFPRRCITRLHCKKSHRPRAVAASPRAAPVSNRCRWEHPPPVSAANAGESF